MLFWAADESATSAKSRTEKHHPEVEEPRQVSEPGKSMVASPESPRVPESRDRHLAGPALAARDGD